MRTPGTSSDRSPAPRTARGVMAACLALVALGPWGAGCTPPPFHLASPTTRTLKGEARAADAEHAAWTLRALPSPAVEVPRGGHLPEALTAALVDRHVAVSARRYALSLRFQTGPPVRILYTPSWGAPVPVDAPHRVLVRAARLAGRGRGGAGQITLGLLAPGTSSQGVTGRALVLRDERGALLAALVQARLEVDGGRPTPIASRPAQLADRLAGGGPRARRGRLRLRVSSHVGYSEVARGKDLCLVTREHRDVEVRVGAGPSQLVPVGSFVDLPATEPGHPPASAGAPRFRLTVLDASVVQTQGEACRAPGAGRLAVVVTRLPRR